MRTMRQPRGIGGSACQCGTLIPYGRSLCRSCQLDKDWEAEVAAGIAAGVPYEAIFEAEQLRLFVSMAAQERALEEGRRWYELAAPL